MGNTIQEPDNNDTDLELDFLGEVSKEGMEKASLLISEFLGKKIKMGPPKVLVLSASDIGSNFGVGDFERMGPELAFNGTYNGNANLMFQKKVVNTIIKEMTGINIKSPDWEETVTDVLSEMGNIVLNGVVGTMSNMVKGKLSFHVPTVKNGLLENIIENNFEKTTEVSFIGLGLFHIEELNADGVISFSFNFDHIADLLSKISSMKES